MSSIKSEIAVVVLSLNDSKGLVAAVRSLIEQSDSAEILVVNSGGGDPGGTLRAAGIEVKVISREERLYAGAVRNLGIQATDSPTVAFLAADCVAGPGWIAGRLRAHRAGADVVSSAVINANPWNPFAIASHLLSFSSRMPDLPEARRTHYGCSYRRDLFARFGPFREDLRTGEDTDYHDRIAGHVRFASAPDVQSLHQHPTTLAGLCSDQFIRGRLFRRSLSKLMARELTETHVPHGLHRDLRRKVSNYWLAARGRDRLMGCVAMPFVAVGYWHYSRGVIDTSCESHDCDQSAAHKLYALLAFHNEVDNLPGYFENLAPHVDGIIALDDGSDDGSAEFVSRQDKVLRLLRKEPQADHHWDEAANQKLLIEAAGDFNPDWLLAVDADERLERHFRVRAFGELGRADREGLQAFSVLLRELWDEPDFYRVDSIWGEKRRARLFKWRADHRFNDRGFHGQWAPINSSLNGQFPSADLVIYHLKMIDPDDRWERREFYESVDPNNQWQSEGYDYLTDETGKILECLPPGRDYIPLGR